MLSLFNVRVHQHFMIQTPICHWNRTVWLQTEKTSKALPFSDGTCLHVVYIIYKLEYDFFTFKYLLNLFNEWLIKCYYIMLCKNICLNEHLSTDKVFNQICFPIVFVVLQHTLTIKGSEWVGPFLFQILWDSNQHICRY